MPAALTDEDKAFIRAILDHPEELTTWLVYADWLDERDDPRAEFIRLQVNLLDPANLQSDPFGLLARLEEVRKKLDPNWVAIFDRPAIENCDEVFAFKCPKKWEKLHGTPNPLVRHCDACEKQVYYCLTLRQAQDHARQGHCVALSEAVPHSPDDIHQDPNRPVVLMTRTVGILRMPEPEPPPPRRRPWWKFW